MKVYRKLNPHSVNVRLRHPSIGMEIGTLEAMTATSVYVSGLSLEDYQRSMIVELDLLGNDWDFDGQSFSYEVTYIGALGIRLKLNNEVFNAGYEMNELDSEYLRSA